MTTILEAPIADAILQVEAELDTLRRAGTITEADAAELMWRLSYWTRRLCEAVERSPVT